MNDQQEATLRKLQDNGSMERLLQSLRSELLTDAVWLQAVQESVQDAATAMDGELTLEDLVASIVPAGQHAVPQAAQARIMKLIEQAVKDMEQQRRQG